MVGEARAGRKACRGRVAVDVESGYQLGVGARGPAAVRARHRDRHAEAGAERLVGEDGGRGAAGDRAPAASSSACVIVGGSSSRWCVTRTTAGAGCSPASLASAASSASRPGRSSPSAGSSSSRSGGRRIRARASRMRRRSPCEHDANACAPTAAQPNCSSSCAARSPRRVVEPVLQHLDRPGGSGQHDLQSACAAARTPPRSSRPRGRCARAARAGRRGRPSRRGSRPRRGWDDACPRRRRAASTCRRRSAPARPTARRVRPSSRRR